MAEIVDGIFELFARFGGGRYGEDLSLESHMLQSAAMAESVGAPRPLVVAALLHDIGHFLSPESEPSAGEDRDLAHEALGAAWLSRGFDEDVTAPIALHVQAKRYLCAVEPSYLERLSDASRLSLALQGGVMSPAEIALFVREEAFEPALTLRRCDDNAKDALLLTNYLDHYREILTMCARQPL